MISRSLADTKAFAEWVAAKLRAGDVITLRGDLGAGKTTFAQSLIAALSPVPVEVTSPTFTLLQTYPVQAASQPVEFFHYDLYRIEHTSALIELGLEEALQGITLIEWPERLEGYALPVSLAIHIMLQEDGTRSIHLDHADARWQQG